MTHEEELRHFVDQAVRRFAQIKKHPNRDGGKTLLVILTIIHKLLDLL